MKFYDVSRPPYLETDASGVSLGAKLPQVRDGMNCRFHKLLDNATLCLIAFASKSLSSLEWYYTNIKQEALERLHSLEKFHHYFFAKEVCIINDHKPLVAVISKDVAMLSQHLQCIMLHNHPYRIHIIYKPCLDLYIVILYSFGIDLNITYLTKHLNV